MGACACLPVHGYVRTCISCLLFSVSSLIPAEQKKKKLNQISVNMFHLHLFLWLPTLVSHTHMCAVTHTRRHTLNPPSGINGSSGLSSLGADCQHQCVRGESYRSSSSPLQPSPGRGQLCLRGVFLGTWVYVHEKQRVRFVHLCM